MIQSLSIDHVLQIITLVVSITSLIIVGTCGLVVWWIKSIRGELKDLGTKFEQFVETYYEKHAETIKREDCKATHAVLDKKVDKLHERVDAMELDRR